MYSSQCKLVFGFSDTFVVTNHWSN